MDDITDFAMTTVMQKLSSGEIKMRAIFRSMIYRSDLGIIVCLAITAGLLHHGESIAESLQVSWQQWQSRRSHRPQPKPIPVAQVSRHQNPTPVPRSSGGFFASKSPIADDRASRSRQGESGGGFFASQPKTRSDCRRLRPQNDQSRRPFFSPEPRSIQIY